MPQIDFFNFFRYVLGTVVGIYATIVTLQSLYGWYVFLNGSDKYITILRRYVIVHGLRLRFKSFWGDVLVCILLCIVFVIIAYAHRIVEQIDHSIHSTPTGKQNSVALCIENYARRTV